MNQRPLADLPPAHVQRVLLTAREVDALLDPDNGVSYHYWTFNGKVPGPMIRVRVGDTVEVTLRNSAGDRMVHSIDLHAALGPGGGAALMQVPPGQERTFSFVATTPGLYVYHCGTPMVGEHIANGMYGLILVEPRGGLPPVDREYYVMQGEIYASGPGRRGETLGLDQAKLLAETPRYYVFNGAIGALTKQYPMTASVGQSVRIFFGNAGPNSTSSPHMVGEIFTKYYEFGSVVSAPLTGVQTATVPPGGAAIFELKARMPGSFNFVDHAIARVQKGLVGVMNVTGEDVAKLMYPGPNEFLGPIPPLAITPADSADALLADVPQPRPDAPAPAALVAVATTRVTMTDTGFVPAVIEVSVGQAITWQNTASTIHTVVDNAAVALDAKDVALPVGAQAFASPFLQSGQSFTYVFHTPGVYHYVCTQHEHSGMVGTIIVKPVIRSAKR
ncbi:MAG TPA: multicopper oxidase domain-containing protein [Terriglobales bacterium]|nr:multicopper oxidase domain-containing protein [Terriglobales bacterium]